MRNRKLRLRRRRRHSRTPNPLKALRRQKWVRAHLQEAQMRVALHCLQYGHDIRDIGLPERVCIHCAKKESELYPKRSLEPVVVIDEAIGQNIKVAVAQFTVELAHFVEEFAKAVNQIKESHGIT